MKKLSLLLLSLAFGSAAVSAQPVSVTAAKERALDFWHQKSPASASARKAPRQEPRLVMTPSLDGLYVFNDEANGGYVVVSGEERMPAVLGYSSTGRYDKNDESGNLNAWLDLYAGQVAYLKSHPGERAVAGSNDGHKPPIEPLLDCAWGQREPYNNMCPKKKKNSSTLTGCVATAMAQVMYYWKWPKETLSPIPAYTTRTKKFNMPELPVTTIDWDNMLPDYSTVEYTQEQADAVATLMLLCGSAVQMDYCESGSGASSTGEEMVLYFDYADNFVFYNRYSLTLTADEWDQMIYDDLAAGHPILYSGFQYRSGHEFVVDGYDDYGYFHINMGWGASSNDYFLLTQIKNYNDGQHATLNLVPADPTQPKTYATYHEGTLEFHHDFERNQRPGVVYSLLQKNYWSNYAEQIQHVVFDSTFVDARPTSMTGWFTNCKQLEHIEGLEYLNTSQVNSFGALFLGCDNLKELDLSHFNTENVDYMGSMFFGCSSLKELDLSSFNTEKVTNMWGMFGSCSSLTSLNISSFNTKNVRDMYRTFDGCTSLTMIDLGSFNTEKVRDMGCFFEDCSSLTTIYVGEGWNLADKSWNDMFSNCTSLVGSQGTSFADLQSPSSTYAHVDEGPDNPGYLSSKQPALDVYADGLALCQRYAVYTDSVAPQLVDSLRSLQSVNAAAASTILASADSLRAVLHDFAYLTDEEKSPLSQQLTAIVAAVTQLKVESDSATCSPLLSLLAYAEPPVDSLRDSLVAYHASLYPVRVSPQQLDSLVTAFASYISTLQTLHIAPLDSASLALSPLFSRLDSIPQELDVQQSLLAALSAELSAIITSVPDVRRQDTPLKVYTLDGRQRTMTARQIDAQPSGLYIYKGRKRVVNCP